LLAKFIYLSRLQKQLILLFVDSVIVVSVLLASFSIRLGYLYLPNDDLIWIIFGAPILAIPIFVRFGLYRAILRYIGFRSLWTISKSVSLFALLWALIAFMFAYEIMPRSVVLIHWVLLTAAISGSRIVGRWILSKSESKRKFQNKTHVLIYGAGVAGRQLANALHQSTEYNLVAFIDDDSNLHHQSINGITIFSRDNLDHLTSSENITEILLAMPSLSREQRKEIVDFLIPFPLLVRSLPSLSLLAQGKVTVNDLLEIDLSDLLGREPVKPNNKLLKVNISKKIVMVTGAGGSIGSELCRQILLLKPIRLVLYEISESSLYQIEQELKNIEKTSVEIIPIIGSVSDENRIEYICNYYEIQTIYHAAAYKHVPLVEFNQSQGVLNNSIGTMVAAKAAISANVEKFVLISTDKAVRPTSIMGATKRVAELILQALEKEQSNTCFTMVRFGNVLDSSGSVIPKFKKQIKDGGPVTVTHSNVVRYFMTIPEAVELVIQAGAMSKGGEVFVLDMGEPIRIYDLAVKMIQLSGLFVRDDLNPKGDIEIKFTGLRPGEKLYEELLVDGNFTRTANKLIMRAEEKMIAWDQLEPMLVQIKEDSTNINKFSDNEKIYESLRKLVPQFSSKSKNKN
jgi:FlaA1/EpsC-like NDP-sugar epimerase